MEKRSKEDFFDEGYYGSSEMKKSSAVVTTSEMLLDLKKTEEDSTNHERSKNAKIHFVDYEGNEVPATLEMNQDLFVWSMSPLDYGDLLLFIDPFEIHSISRSVERLAIKNYFGQKYQMVFIDEGEAKEWLETVYLGKKIREIDVVRNAFDSDGETFSSKYTLQKDYASGSNGFVKFAKDNVTDKTVLCKFIPIARTELAFDAAFDKEVPVELAALRKLKHPSIVSLIQAYEYADLLYILVFSYDEQKRPSDLHAVVDDYSAGEFPLDMAADCARQIASALQYLHSESIVHGDVKDENILVCKEPGEGDSFKFYLIDFGSSQLDRFNGPYRGTMYYSPPPEETTAEQIDYASHDIFAFGRLILLMLFGDTVGWADWQKQASASPVPEIRKRVQSLDEKWKLILNESLEKDAKKRCSALRIEELLMS